MPAPIDPDKRRAIAAAIRAGTGQRSRNSIARQFGVAGRTVGKIAEEQGLTDAWDRTVTARASASKQADNRARRAELGQLLLADSFRLRERLWQPAETVLPNGDTTITELPGARDVRDFAVAVQGAVRTHLDLDRHDAADDGVGAARSLIAEFMDSVTSSLRPPEQ